MQIKLDLTKLKPGYVHFMPHSQKTDQAYPIAPSTRMGQQVGKNDYQVKQ